MSLNRHAASRDLNEAEVLAPFRAAGWVVILWRDIDALVVKPDGSHILVEVKNAAGRDRLTPSQQAILDAGAALCILHDPAQAEQIVRGYYECRRTS
jgi:hypothetical protein